MASSREDWGGRCRSTSPTLSLPSSLVLLPPPTRSPVDPVAPTPATRSTRSDAADLQGGLWRSGSLHPHGSPVRRGGHGGTNTMGIGWSSSRGLGINSSGGDDGLGIGSSSGQNHRRGIRWDPVQQREVQIGVDFVPDSVDGDCGEFVFIPDSDDEVESGWSNFATTDDEVVPETAPEDLVAAEYSGMEVQAGNVDDGGTAIVQPTLDVVGPHTGTNAEPIAVQAPFVAVDSDAETDTVDQDFEDFKLQLWKEFFPVSAHPTLEALRCKKKVTLTNCGSLSSRVVLLVFNSECSVS